MIGFNRWVLISQNFFCNFTAARHQNSNKFIVHFIHWLIWNEQATNYFVRRIYIGTRQQINWYIEPVSPIHSKSTENLVYMVLKQCSLRAKYINSSAFAVVNDNWKGFDAVLHLIKKWSNLIWLKLKAEVNFIDSIYNYN